MSKNWIAGAVGHKGALHKELGIPQKDKIPAATLDKAAHAGGKLGKRARLAETLKGFSDSFNDSILRKSPIQR
jgi:hypothetical protein